MNLLYIAMMLLFAVPRTGSAKNKLKVGAIHYPPFFFVASSEKTNGFDFDILTAIAPVANFDLEWHIMDLEQVFDSLEAGSLDIAIGGFYIEEIDTNKFLHTIPYAKSGLVIVVKTEEHNIKSPRDLEGKTVGVLKGRGAEKWIDKFQREGQLNVSKKAFNGIDELYDALAKDEIDALIDDYLHASYYIHFRNSGVFKLVGHPHIFYETNIAFILPQTTQAQLIKRELDKTLSWYTSSRHYEMEYKRWFMKESPYAQKRRETRLLLALIISFAIIIFAGILWVMTTKRREMRNISRGIARSYSFAVELRDILHRGHSLRVAAYTEMIAKKMGVYSSKLEFAALLHDIGKLAIPDVLLDQRGQMSRDEVEILEKHPVFGYELVRRIPYFEDVALWIRWHHEHWDGSGYPDGLSGEKIPLEARILAVADAFDLMTTGGDGRQPLDVESAKNELRRGAGRFWDPEVVKVAVEVLRPVNVGEEYKEFYESIDKVRQRAVQDIYRLQAIYKILEVVQISSVLPETLQKILEIIRSYIDPNAVYFLLLSDQNGELRVVAQLGIEFDIIGLTIPKDRGVTRKAFERREPILINDVSKEPLYLSIPGLEIKSELAVPLMIRDKCIGVIDVESERLNAFTEDDVDFMKAISTAIAAALEIARYHGEHDLEKALVEKKYTEKLQPRIQQLIDKHSRTNEPFSVLLIKFKRQVELVPSMFPEGTLIFKHNNSYTVVFPSLPRKVVEPLAKRLISIYKDGAFGIAEFPKDGKSVNQLLAVAYKRQTQSEAHSSER